MSSYSENNRPRVTVRTLAEKKRNGEKVACLTAYDFTMARLVDRAGIDLILVGDSAANIMAGYDTTLPITLDEMIIYARSVVRGATHSMVVVDLPFGSYQGDPKLGLASAVRVIKETGAAAVKLEGGLEVLDTVKLILQAGIPVCAHLGLTPQSINAFGGYGVRAKDDAEAAVLMESAEAMAKAGCFAIVLEKVPAALAAKVTQQLPGTVVIGIGAGSGTDGQILVAQDMLGMNGDFKPKFLRLYGNIGNDIVSAIEQYCNDVRTVDFPSVTEQY